MGAEEEPPEVEGGVELDAFLAVLAGEDCGVRKDEGLVMLRGSRGKARHSGIQHTKTVFIDLAEEVQVLG